ncbi:hypothetical protein LCGC14_0560350 [marine sediment metagenome]|uniref:Uncharacterized protein n=1 Tax=marine sediment metagenome TaxID=412755 RepID=A0A0F9S5Z5_9ZZZZ
MFDKNDVEGMLKDASIICLFGMVFGTLIMMSILWFTFRNYTEVILGIAAGIVFLCGLSIVFIVYLVYYLKTYTIISRKNLKQLKKKE